ncbi:hypothetical protein D3C84_1243300 [compost metagenome]
MGVIPKPKVVPLKSALEPKVSTSLQLFSASGIHKPALIAVDVWVLPKIPYTFKKGNSQISGLMLIELASATELLKRII